MTPDEVIAICRDPTRPLDALLDHLDRCWTHVELAFTHLDDERCLLVMQSLHHAHSDVAHEAFFARPLAFYLKHKDTAFAPWVPMPWSIDIWLNEGAVDVANKVAYVTQ